MICAYAHLATHSETKNKFLDALAIFMASVPANVLTGVMALNWKSTNDILKKLVSEHRIAVPPMSSKLDY